MFVSAWQFVRYPVSIYHQPVRALLTYVLPVAMLSTVPSLVLAAVIAVITTNSIWTVGLRRHTGATG